MSPREVQGTTNTIRRDISLPLRPAPSWCATAPDPAGVLEALPGARTAAVVAGGPVASPNGSNAALAGIVLSGAVIVSAAYGPSGRSAAALFGPGDGFGFDAVTALEPVTRVSAPFRHPRGLVPSRVLLVPVRSARAAIVERPIVATTILELVAAQAERAERRLIRSLTLPAADRLLAELRDLAAGFGAPAPRGRRIELPLTQDLLAELVGAVRESVNRALRTLVAQGMIERAASSYVVLDSFEP